MPKVSVIIPVYNVEKYLKECLESVLNQTLTDIEIICIDNNSTDNSIQILREYANKDKRIIILEQKIQGAGAARNTGMKIAKGEFIIFMDADDKYPDQDTLKVLYDTSVKNAVDICGGELEQFSENKAASSDLPEFVFKKYGLTSSEECPYCIGFTRFFFKNSFLKKNNIVFPEYIRCEDPPFFVKAIIAAGKFYAINRIVYSYRCVCEHRQGTFKEMVDTISGIADVFNYTRNQKFRSMYEDNLSRLKRQVDFYRYSLKGKEREEFITYLKKVLPIEFQIIEKSLTSLNSITMETINSLIGDKKVMLWGASMFLEDLLEKEKLKNDNILGIIDKNIDKQGKKCCNYEIFHPDILNKIKPDGVILTVFSKNEILYSKIKKEIETNYKGVKLLPNIFEREACNGYENNKYCNDNR